jgi:molybdopterin-guanine dinucleotide biosynthesis protein A
VIALVLAGGPSDAVAKTQPGAPNKAFVRIGDETLVERVIRALRASVWIDRIIVVAPSGVRDDPALALADDVRPDGVKIRDSLRNGLEGLPAFDLVLVAASDLPVLTAESIDDFARRAHHIDPDLGYGCVERRAHLARYPRVPHTWAHLRDGTFCGTGFVVIKPRVLPTLERFVEHLGAARKNPFALASLFGWDVLVKFVFRRLSIADAEARATSIVGAPVRAIVSPYPEIAVNVDRVSDIALAEELVGS